MDHIRNILPTANASRGEAVEFTAAAVVAAINEVLRRRGFPVGQAQTISVARRWARIRVSHGAVAGRLQQEADHIIEDANTLIRQRFPDQPSAVEGFTTRLG